MSTFACGFSLLALHRQEEITAARLPAASGANRYGTRSLRGHRGDREDLIAIAMTGREKEERVRLCDVFCVLHPATRNTHTFPSLQPHLSFLSVVVQLCRYRCRFIVVIGYCSPFLQKTPRCRVVYHRRDNTAG